MTNEITPIKYATRYNVQLAHCGRYATIATCYSREEAQAIIDAPSNKRDWADRSPRITINNRVARFGVIGVGNTVPGSTAYATVETAKKWAKRYNRGLPTERYYVAQYQGNAWVRVA
jgi:hypothetical protein